MHPTKEFFSLGFYKNNDKCFQKKFTALEKMLNRKAMNFSIFLWYMKILIFPLHLALLLSLSSTYSFHNVNLSKHEKCENRFRIFQSAKNTLSFMKKVSTSSFLQHIHCHFYETMYSKHTHTHPALRGCNSFAKGK